jgi:hypothetical protein
MEAVLKKTITREVKQMEKLRTDITNNNVIELCRTRTGSILMQWEYYDKSKNTEMYLKSKITFKKDEEEKAHNAYDELFTTLKKIANKKNRGNQNENI